MYTSMSLLLQLEQRKVNNMSRLLPEESYQVLTIILQGTNVGKGYSLIPTFKIDRRIESKTKRTEKTRLRK